MKRFDYESKKFELMHTGKVAYKKGAFYIIHASKVRGPWRITKRHQGSEASKLYHGYLKMFVYS